MSVCFVLMPFGLKRDPAGGPDIDFNRVYREGIEPAIVAAGIRPVRADEEVEGGFIHKPLFERLLLSDFAIADLTTANPNVFYELGVRHAVRPRTTLPIFAHGQRIPFDLQAVRAMPYSLGADNRFGEAEAATLREELTKKLQHLRDLASHPTAVDSPLVQLLQGYKVPDLAHLRTDSVEEQLLRTDAMRGRLREAAASSKPAEALAGIEASLGDLRDVEAGVIVALYLAYRSVKAFDAMLRLYERMPAVLQSTVLAREQRAFALNRLAEGKEKSPREKARLRDQAEEILTAIVREVGHNAETCGLLGRIYKDRWEEAQGSSPAEADAWLEKATAEYRRGFEADWRDAYPGINAATLLEVRGTPAALAERARILPVVRFAAAQRAKAACAGYWEYATLLEAAVLGDDFADAEQQLGHALATARWAWEVETTLRNLELIRAARAARGADTSQLAAIRARLDAKAAALKP
jgi:hypothetical protein